MRYRKYQMEIWYWQKLLSSCRKPFGAYLSLAFWTVTIAAGVINWDFTTAVAAAVEVPAHRCRSTVKNIVYHLPALRMRMELSTRNGLPKNLCHRSAHMTLKFSGTKLDPRGFWCFGVFLALHRCKHLWFAHARDLKVC